MDLIKAIFGCYNIWQPEAKLLLGLMKTTRWGHYSLKTPVIVTTEHIETRNKVAALQYFPQYRSNSPRNVSNVLKDDIEIIDPNRLFNRVPIEIESFDFGRVNRIVDQVLEEGALTLVIRDNIEMLKFLGRLKNLKEFFKYSSSSGGFARADYDPKVNEIFTHISFYSLPYIIPTFAKKTERAVGVNIGVCGLYQENLHILIFKEEFMLLSMSDDILLVDGQVIRSPGFIHPNTIGNMEYIVTKDKERKETGGAQPKPKKAPKSSSVYYYTSSTSTDTYTTFT